MTGQPSACRRSRQSPRTDGGRGCGVRSTAQLKRIYIRFIYSGRHTKTGEGRRPRSLWGGPAVRHDQSLPQGSAEYREAQAMEWRCRVQNNELGRHINWKAADQLQTTLTVRFWAQRLAQRGGLLQNVSVLCLRKARLDLPKLTAVTVRKLPSPPPETVRGGCLN